jgi:hypothetical protein
VISTPFPVDAVHVTTALALPRTALTFVGAVGAPAGITAFEAVEALDVPTAVVAVTVKV